MKKKIVVGVFVSLTLLLVFSTGSGQGLCVMDRIRVSEVKVLCASQS